MKYRVILKVAYHEAWFDFDDADTACQFAGILLSHQSPNEDTRKTDHIRLEVIDTTIKVDEDEKEED